MKRSALLRHLRANGCELLPHASAVTLIAPLERRNMRYHAGAWERDKLSIQHRQAELGWQALPSRAW